MTIADFKTGVTFDISIKTNKNSITPQIVGNAFNNLADIVGTIVTTATTVINGLTYSDGAISLGGVLTGNTTIKSSAYTITFGNALTGGNGEAAFGIFSPGVFGLVGSNNNRLTQITNTSGFQIVSDLYTSFSGGSSLGEQALDMLNTGFIVKNTITNDGIIYDRDYSSGYTIRSLIDKGYSDLNNIKNFTNISDIIGGIVSAQTGNIYINGLNISTSGFTATDFLNPSSLGYSTMIPGGLSILSSIRDTDNTLKKQSSLQVSVVDNFFGLNISSAVINGSTNFQFESSEKQFTYYAAAESGVTTDKSVVAFNIEPPNRYNNTPRFSYLIYDNLQDNNITGGFVNIGNQLQDAFGVNYIKSGDTNVNTINGLSQSGNTISLGGNLNRTTSIVLDNGDLIFKNNSAYQIDNLTTGLSNYLFDTQSVSLSTNFNQGSSNTHSQSFYLDASEISIKQDFRGQSLIFSRDITTAEAPVKPITLGDSLGQGITVEWTDDTNLVDSSYVPKRYVDTNFVSNTGGTISGDIEITDSTKGIILHTPTGERIRATAIVINGSPTLQLTII